MKKIKLIALILICLLFVFSLTACSGSSKKEITVDFDLTTMIESAQLQYPSSNNQFRYNVYDSFVEITECLSAESEITIPDEIESVPVKGIRENAFENNKTITKLTMSDNILFVNESAFVGCENLLEVKFSDSLIQMDKEAFRDCISLREVSLPASLSIISKSCFKNCTNLEKVMIDGTNKDPVSNKKEAGYREISGSAFAECPYLRSVWIANDISVVDKNAFKDSTEFLRIYGYIASPAAKFAAENLIDFEKKDKKSFNNAISTSANINIPKYKSYNDPIASNVWSIEILPFKEYTSINSFDAPEGKVYLVIPFRVMNKTSEAKFFNYLNIRSEVSGYTKYPTLLNTPKIDTNDFLSFEIPGGTTKTGYLLYEVNENWKYTAVDFENFAGFEGKGNNETCLMVTR